MLEGSLKVYPRLDEQAVLSNFLLNTFARANNPLDLFVG